MVVDFSTYPCIRIYKTDSVIKSLYYKALLYLKI